MRRHTWLLKTQRWRFESSGLRVLRCRDTQDSAVGGKKDFHFCLIEYTEVRSGHLLAFLSQEQIAVPGLWSHRDAEDSDSSSHPRQECSLWLILVQSSASPPSHSVMLLMSFRHSRNQKGWNGMVRHQEKRPSPRLWEHRVAKSRARSGFHLLLSPPGGPGERSPGTRSTTGHVAPPAVWRRMWAEGLQCDLLPLISRWS